MKNNLILSEEVLLELEALINGYVHPTEDVDHYFSKLVLFWKEIPTIKGLKQTAQCFIPLVNYVIKKMNLNYEIFSPIGLKEVENAIGTFNSNIDGSIFEPYAIECLFFAFKKEQS